MKWVRLLCDHSEMNRTMLGIAGGFSDVGYNIGTLAVGSGSGSGRLIYLVPPLEAIKARVAEDGSFV
jgi:hypothetical protein